MYLGDDIQKALREMKAIGSDEVILKEGDIFVALNVLSKKRRIIQIDQTIIENISQNKSKDRRRILKG